MSGEIIVGAVIGAGVTLASQFVGVWGQSLAARQSGKIVYLQDAQAEILKLLNSKFSNVMAIDMENCIKEIEEGYNNKETVERAALGIKETYVDTISTFFGYRHLLPKKIRKIADSYYVQSQQILIGLGALNNITSLPEDQKKKLVISYYTLTALTFIGLLESLEKLADKISK